MRQLQDCVLQLLPEGSTVVPLSRSGELDQEWLRTLTRQGEAEGAEHGQKVVQKLIAYLPGECQALGRVREGRRSVVAACTCADLPVVEILITTYMTSKVPLHSVTP